MIGELLPKNIALRHAEAIACRMAAPMALLSTLVTPVVWLLDKSTKLILLFVGQANELQSWVTDEEIKTFVAEAHSAGAIEADEQQMIAGVLRLGDRAARALMTPRTEVDWLNLGEPENLLREKLIETSHARLPVSRGDMDDMIGVLLIRDLLGTALRGEPLDLESHVRFARRSCPIHRRARRAECFARSRDADGARARRIWPFRRRGDAGRYARRYHRRVQIRRGA